LIVVLGGTRARKGGRKKAAGADLSEEESEVENLVAEQPKQKPRPRPKRVTRSNPIIEEEPADEPPAEVPSREPSPEHDAAGPGDDASLRVSTPDRPTQEEDQQTPKSSLKRPRTDEEEEEDAADASPEAEVTPVKDVQVRRKRIRH
jgi:cohesin complex subunit SA-1/2